MLTKEKRVQKSRMSTYNLEIEKREYIKNNHNTRVKAGIDLARERGYHNRPVESRFEILDIENKQEMGRKEAKYTKIIEDYEKNIQDFDTKITGHQIVLNELLGNVPIKSRFDIIDIPKK